MFDKVPDEVWSRIGRFLPDYEDRINLFTALQSSKAPRLNPSFFNSARREFLLKRSEALAKLILELVAYGEGAARILIKLFPESLCARLAFTDPVGNVFSQISAWEYMLLAGDIPMGKMMLECLPKGARGEAIATKLIAQYERLEQDGICYTFDGVTTKAKYFDLELLISGLKAYITLSELPDYDAVEKHWCTLVGGAQIRLPMVIRQWYCSTTVNFNRPESLELPLLHDRRLFVGIDNGIAVSLIWDDAKKSDRILGTHYAIYKCSIWSSAHAGPYMPLRERNSRWWMSGVDASKHMKALQHLSKVIASGRLVLREQLDLMLPKSTDALAIKPH